MPMDTENIIFHCTPTHLKVACGLSSSTAGFCCSGLGELMLVSLFKLSPISVAASSSNGDPSVPWFCCVVWASFILPAGESCWERMWK